MEKLELCKDCDAFTDCESHCDDALHYKKMEGNRKQHRPEYAQEKLIDRTIEFAEEVFCDPTETPISIINHRKKFNKSKLKKRKLK